MNIRGNITVFFCLILTAVFSLITVSILTVKISAGRMQLINSADQAVFSLFSQYDRDLQEKYGLFFIDLGMDSGSLQLGECIEYLEDAARYVTDPQKGNFPGHGKNILSIIPCNTGIVSYRLASGADDKVLASQMVRYMKDTAGAQILSVAAGSLSSDSVTASSLEQKGRSCDTASIGKALEVSEGSPEREQDSPGTTLQNPVSPADTGKALGFLGTLGRINIRKNGSVTDLTVPSPEKISSKTADISSFYSRRSHVSGLGPISVPEDPDNAANLPLVAEYILQKTGNALSPAPDPVSLAYQCEYIIAGKSSDRENLKSVLNRLLLIRTGANSALILSDASLHSEVSGMAALLSSVCLVPEAEPLFEAAIIAAWAWCESVIDVRAIMSGYKVPLIKTRADWQVGLESLGIVFSSPDTLIKKHPSGLSYTDYLRILIYPGIKGNAVHRFADTVEDTIRKTCGRSGFNLGMCCDEMEIEMEAELEHINTFTASKKYSYFDRDP